MTIEDILQDCDRRMKHAIDAMLHDFSTYRTGRASPVVLERVHADYYGVDTPIAQMANVTVPDSRTLMITPYDKNSLGVIEKAILKSDLGINPNNDGINIRLNFPPMSEDRRKDLVKQVHGRTEQACVAVRNVRHDAIHHLKAEEKAKAISEDELKSQEAKVQKLTDKYVAEAHDLGKKKEAELMEV
ncbi:MAG: Ribosome-recycling factor [Fimbriimonadaceae bacterium]|nr:Ribosome-recycling factor [Fimbriimonadaceae bacterium]